MTHYRGVMTLTIERATQNDYGYSERPTSEDYRFALDQNTRETLLRDIMRMLAALTDPKAGA